MRCRIVALCLAALVPACSSPSRPWLDEGGAAPVIELLPAAAAQSAADVGDGSRLVLPAEYEPIERLLLVWDDYVADFLNDIIAGVWGQVPVMVVVDTERPSELLNEHTWDSQWVQVVHMPVGSIWIRDFGPLVARSSTGKRHIVHFEYISAGQEKEVPARLGHEMWRNWPQHKIAVEFEGGNLQVDGRGRCITTAGYVDDDDVPMTIVDAGALALELRQKLGCNQIVTVPPLYGEPTAHVDMFATITGPGEVIVGRYEPQQDPVNAARLDRVAAILQANGFAVRRIPMPGHDDGLFRSYTNALAANHVVLVPVYPEDQGREEEALAVFQAAYPGREIIPIVASEVIKLEGAIHCATMTIAADRPVLAAGRRNRPDLKPGQQSRGQRNPGRRKHSKRW